MMMMISDETRRLMLRMAPLICRIVGSFFLLSGLAALAFGLMFAFKKPINPVITFVLLGSGAFDILIGFILVRYLPSFIVSRLERQLQK